ncbi:MAG: 2OG-Fe(II) oxygenase [Comamonas sp.]
MSQSLEQLSASVPGSTPALMQWIQGQLAAGHSTQTLEKSLIDSGWVTSVAQAALAACTATPNPSVARSEPVALPGPDLQALPSEIDVGDRRVQVLMTLQRPQLVLFGNLLSDEECDHIVDEARPAMARSRTVASHGTLEEINPDRTSDGMFFKRGQTPVVQKLEARIARLLHWPLENGEGLQVLNYLPGAQYKPHHDYFSPLEPSSAAILQRGGQRVGTMVIYLNEVEAGGCTYFPETQLRIHPRKGSAVFFSYAGPHAQTLTLHAGEPVLQGEKWIATKWLREREFQ